MERRLHRYIRDNGKSPIFCRGGQYELKFNEYLMKCTLFARSNASSFYICYPISPQTLLFYLYFADKEKMEHRQLARNTQET